jgi:hypothetical protein
MQAVKLTLVRTSRRRLEPRATAALAAGGSGAGGGASEIAISIPDGLLRWTRTG